MGLAKDKLGSGRDMNGDMKRGMPYPLVNNGELMDTYGNKLG